jgi:organic radical activating enzyme
MLIAVYYETDEIEPLYSLFESFRVYLNRNKKITSDRKKRFLNLIKFTKKLTKIIPGDKKAIDKVKAEVATTQNIINLKWLKEKIAELE